MFLKLEPTLKKMATLNLILDKRRTNKDNNYPLVFRIYALKFCKSIRKEFEKISMDSTPRESHTEIGVLSFFRSSESLVSTKDSGHHLVQFESSNFL